MPDYNTPPGDLTNGDLGQIVTQRNGRVVSTYQITPLDYAYFASAIFYEGGPPLQVAWAMIQMFGSRYASGKYRSVSPPTAGFKRCIETYCAPVNPAYTYTGDPAYTRATQACGTIRDSHNRILYRGTPTSGAAGSVQVMSSRNGIPGPPLTFVWNRIHCRLGRGSAHDNESEARRAARRGRINNIWDMLHGQKQRAWNTISANARLTAWEICNALIGNPIPGFDGWAACSQFTTRTLASGRVVHGIVINLPGENPAQNETVARSEVASHRGAKIGFRFASTGNCMVYRADMRADDVVYTQRTINGVATPSLRRPVPSLNSRTGRGGAVPAPSSGGTTEIATTPGVGQAVATTSEGLAPTQEVPASVSASASAQTESTLGDERALMTDLEEWAATMESRLTDTFGGGRNI